MPDTLCITDYDHKQNRYGTHELQLSCMTKNL